MCSLIVCSISLYCYVRIKRVYYYTKKKSEKCAAMRLTDKIMTSTCTVISDRTHDQENVEIQKFKLSLN